MVRMEKRSPDLPFDKKKGSITLRKVFDPIFSVAGSAVRYQDNNHHSPKKLEVVNPKMKETLKVNKYDRDYQVWKREPLSIELFSEKTFLQKLEYIPYNPVVAKLVALPEDYTYSSARFYETGLDEFNIITHYTGT